MAHEARATDVTPVRPPPSLPQIHWSGLLARGAAPTWGDLADTGRVRFTHSGRGAIYQYFASLKQSRSQPVGRTVVLMPSFHCPTVVDPVLHAGYDVRFYAITPDMHIDRADFMRKLDDSVAAAIFIRYFGFAETDAQLVEACRVGGVKVVEDCCHSFLSANPVRLAHSGADATVYSFWKLAPSLVGGGVLPGTDLPEAFWSPQTDVSESDSRARTKVLTRQLLEQPLSLASRVLKRGGAGAETPESPAVRKPAEEAYPYDKAASSWRIPSSSHRIVVNAPLGHIVSRRRSNYERLARAIQPSSELVALRPALAADTCPWGLPVRLEKRAERDYLIRSRGVPVFTFGEVLHPLLFTQHATESGMLEDARDLSNTTLAFAIHQDLSTAQLDRFASEINSYVATL